MAAERVMLLTGAGGGIGRRLARRLADQGHRLWLTDLDGEALARSASESGLVAGERVALSALDVRDASAWQALVRDVVARFGRLDVLFNVAGFMRSGSLLAQGVSDVDLHLDVNAKGVIHGTRAAAAHMVTAGGGHIVNVASLMGVAPIPGFALYSASKHAVRGFSIAAALELRPRGVAVTVVCPDAVATNMLDAQLESSEARIAFSGPRPLEIDEIVEPLVGRVLRDRPLELTLAPPRSGRALMSKLVAAAPVLAVPLEPLFGALGDHQRRRHRRRRT